jgi:hypothetical protein
MGNVLNQVELRIEDILDEIIKREDQLNSDLRYSDPDKWVEIDEECVKLSAKLEELCWVRDQMKQVV